MLVLFQRPEVQREEADGDERHAEQGDLQVRVHDQRRAEELDVLALGVLDRRRLVSVEVVIHRPLPPHHQTQEVVTGDGGSEQNGQDGHRRRRPAASCAVGRDGRHDGTERCACEPPESGSHQPRRECGLTRSAREDRAGERRHEQDADGERHQYHHGVDAVQELFLEPQARRQRLQIPAQEPLEDEDEGVGDDEHERVLDERLQPAPEQPLEGRHDEERHEQRADQRTDRAGDHAERDDEEQRELRQADDDQHRPVEQVGQDRPGVRLLERVPERVQTLLRVLDRPRADEVGEIARLVRDEVGERDADAGDRRLVVRDHRVAERDDEQELGEAEHVLARLRHASIIRMPCHASRIVANERNIRCPMPRNCGSCVASRAVIACCTVAIGS